MLILTAVNEMLTAISRKPVTAYTDGIAAEAATYLDQWSTQIQQRGWHCNTEGRSKRGITGIDISPPDTTIAYSVAPAGTFLAGETVTETTSGATGRFCYLEGGKVYMNALTGTFTGAKVLTGGTSGATVTGTTLASVTSGYLYVDSDILSADPLYQYLTLRGGRFYNIEDSTYTFDEPVKVTQVRKLAFADLPDPIARLITVHALIDFCAKTIKQPPPFDSEKRLREAQTTALQDELDRSDLNLMDSAYHRGIAGNRSAPIYPR